MKILKSLNKKCLSILIIIFLFELHIKAEDQPIDIWNLDKIKKEQLSKENLSESDIDKLYKKNQSSVYDLQSQKIIDDVKIDSTLNSKEVKIIGLYDPADYGLKIDMWSYSDGDKLKNLFSNLSKLKLSKDASDLMNILLLTNAYHPQNDFKESEFLKIKSDWLIKNDDLDLIDKYFNFHSICKKNLFAFVRAIEVFHSPACYRTKFSISRYCFRPNQ